MAVHAPKAYRRQVIRNVIKIMKQRYWHIEGYNSLRKIYDKKIKVGCFSDSQIKNLLKALTAKAGLSFDEIVGAYAKKNTKISNEHLLIQKD